MKILLSVLWLIAVLMSRLAAQERIDSLSAGSISFSDSTIAVEQPPRESSIMQNTITSEHSHMLPLEYSKPGIADLITDLPGAWVTWARMTFRAENIPMYTGIGVLTAGMVVTDHQTYQPMRTFYFKNEPTPIRSVFHFYMPNTV